MPADFLTHAVVYLAAAVLSVPIAKRLGLGSVLGYLIAGAVIGPSMLNLVGDDGDTVRQFSEYGVVMLLFLVGLELEPARLWTMRGQLLGLGGAQVGLTAALLAGLAMLAGIAWQPAVAGGLILALSSTAIIVQTLQERRLFDSPGGRATFSVLLFQALAIIPLLALWPLLATAPGHGGEIEGRPAWAQGLRYAIALAVIIGGGRYLVGPLFRLIASTQLRELFTATALLIVAGIAALTQWVGLSAALGTFIGGVLLANSEYRHELVADIEPFKGLLLGLFFISVGAGIDFNLLRSEPVVIASLLGAMVVVKFLVLAGLGTLFRLPRVEALLLALTLIVGDEFSFVLCTLSVQQGVLNAEQADLLVATIALSMALTPLLFVIYERLVVPRLATPRRVREADVIESTDSAAIIAGFGRFGHMVGRLLRANGISTTVLDHDSEQVDVLRALGLKVYYGDASRLDLLHAAGAARAKLFILAIDDREKSLGIVATLQRHFPHLTILARAIDRLHADELAEAGVPYVYRDMLASSLEMGTDALRLLGFRAFDARRRAMRFRQHDAAANRDLRKLRHDETAYMSRARQIVETLDLLLRTDAAGRRDPGKDGWEPMPRGDTSRDAPPPPPARD